MTIRALGFDPKNCPAATLATPVPWLFSSMMLRSGHGGAGVDLLPAVVEYPPMMRVPGK
jgi:hypothetical protein